MSMDRFECTNGHPKLVILQNISKFIIFFEHLMCDILGAFVLGWIFPFQFSLFWEW